MGASYKRDAKSLMAIALARQGDEGELAAPKFSPIYTQDLQLTQSVDCTHDIGIPVGKISADNPTITLVSISNAILTSMPQFRQLTARDLLDNDWYKFTMQYAGFAHGHADTTVAYRLTDRKGSLNAAMAGLPSRAARAAAADALASVLGEYAALRFEPGDARFVAQELRKILRSDGDSGAAPPQPTLREYETRLVARALDADVAIDVAWDDAANALSVDYSGPWFATILFEVPFMALIVEFFNGLTVSDPPSDEYLLATLDPKLKAYAACNANVTEFGTRRRFNQHSHFLISSAIRDASSSFLNPPIYTSNVLLSKINNTPPRGTCAHEYFMFYLALARTPAATASTLFPALTLQTLVDSIKSALESWLQIFSSVFALTDVYTTQVFFLAYKNLDASLQSRINYRCDSGDEFSYCAVIADILGRLGLNVETHLNEKLIMFSNSLSPSKVCQIQEKLEHDRQSGATAVPKAVSYGVGTNFTNDTQYKTMDIVIKLNWVDINKERCYVFKLSDVKSKFVGNESLREEALACVANL
ncbi:hypothetical protein HK100_003702 [Physocladia obscura]|uniref:nicotinate phosphoribosyltransferase n=1 Tax=Physocladia obscura TaxID=109957 RepID=A0AAD5X984_9FUNG|nr:hypothetical protein HK100_003702 [Physocladia obscura]